MVYLSALGSECDKSRSVCSLVGDPVVVVVLSVPLFAVFTEVIMTPKIRLHPHTVDNGTEMGFDRDRANTNPNDSTAGETQRHAWIIELFQDSSGEGRKASTMDYLLSCNP